MLGEGHVDGTAWERGVAGTGGAADTIESPEELGSLRGQGVSEQDLGR
jgi:hypothetical protein